MRVARGLVFGVALLLLAPASATRPAETCDGDCDRDARVTIDELVRLVTAVLDGNVAACSAGDIDRDNAISVDEVVAAVTNALFGCRVLPPPSDKVRLFPGLKLEVGSDPISLAVADVDGDGRLDVSTANRGSTDVSLLLRSPGGGFQRYLRVAGGTGPAAVIATALGVAVRPAMLAANSLSDDVSVIAMSDGAVTTERYPVGRAPTALAAADLDGDSVNDVVVGNRASGDVSVLLGRKDGSLMPPQSSAVGGAPASIAVGDVDGDSIPDIVTALGTPSLAILSGGGGGELSAPRLIDAGQSASFVAIEDFNLDDARDLVVVGEIDELQGVATLGVLLGRGNGTFQTTERVVIEARFEGIAVDDLDGDDAPEVISADDRNVVVRFGNGTGTFPSSIALPSGCPVSAVAVADLDGDAVKDVVYTCGADDEVAVLWGLGGRRFAAEQVLGVAGLLPTRVLAVDINGDTAVDLATVNGLSDDISIVAGEGDGRFAAAVEVATQPGLLAAAFGDLDGDGAADLVSGHESSACRDCLAVFRNAGENGFERRLQLSVSPRLVGLAIANVGDDSLGDIISLGADGVSLFVGLGDFVFEPARTFATGIAPRAMAVADLDGDGISDVATANVGSVDVSVLLSTRAGAFVPAATLPLSFEPAGIVAADVDADGRIDLVVNGGGLVAVFLGRGTGAFSSEERVAAPLRGGPIALADVDGDLLIDLVAVDSGSAVYLGAGALSFRPALRFAGNALAADLTLADVHGDGRLDMVTANSTLPGSISVMAGLGP